MHDFNTYELYTYLVKDVISSIELRWRDVVAHVPALLPNELPPVSWSYISHTSSWLHCVHLGMDIGTDLVGEFFA
jgi:hypothetical protein